MPVSLFSPLARGFGAWTGELHLAENDKVINLLYFISLIVERLNDILNSLAIL